MKWALYCAILFMCIYFIHLGRFLELFLLKSLVLWFIFVLGWIRSASWLQLDHLLNLLLHLCKWSYITASLLSRAPSFRNLVSNASENGRSLAVSVIAMMTTDENLLVHNGLVHCISVWLLVVCVVSVVVAIRIRCILTGQTAVRSNVLILSFYLLKIVSCLLFSSCCKNLNKKSYTLKRNTLHHNKNLTNRTADKWQQINEFHCKRCLVWIFKLSYVWWWYKWETWWTFYIIWLSFYTWQINED